MRAQNIFIKLLALILVFLFLISPKNSLTNWQIIKEKGYLSWITRVSPLTYYTGLDGIIGLEYDILKKFSDENSLELRIETAQSNKELFIQADNHQVDIAGANFTSTSERKKKYLLSTNYDSTFTVLVSSLAKPKIRVLNELKNLSGMTFESSSYVVKAKELESKHQSHIESVVDKSLFDILNMITAGEIDFTIADSNIVDIFKLVVPKLRIGMKLSEEDGLVFISPKSHDKSLIVKLDEFIEKYKNEGNVSRYKKYIASNLPNSNPADTVQFLKNYQQRWPLVKTIIYSTAKKFKLSPVFLGAIAYQESHWNANAISPTLVKGLMMLTKAVAKEQNVTDRNNPLQSLEGGAKYFLKMKRKIPERIPEPDRTSFALASYNIGFGNLEKARILTQKAGKNPDLWQDVKLFLPELNKTIGIKADGKTAVRYVDNIYVYQNLLQWKEQQ